MSEGMDIGEMLSGLQQTVASTMAVGLRSERVQAAVRVASELASAYVGARNGLRPDEATLKEFARMGVALVDAVTEECRKLPLGAQAVTPEQLANLAKSDAPQPPDWVSEILKEAEVAEKPPVSPSPSERESKEVTS